MVNSLVSGNTHLNDNERRALMDDMRSFDEPMPSVGIFCYDPEDHSLFGVHKKELTPREVEDAAEKGTPSISYPEFDCQKGVTADHTLKGRVSWNGKKFIVLVDNWAEPIQEELTELLEKEFSLPYFEFVYNEHLNLGHSRSGEMLPS